MKKSLFLALGFLVSWNANAGEVRFEARAADLPFEQSYEGGWEHFVGGGMATFDCNGDNLLDAFLAGGNKPSRLIVNTTKSAGGTISFIDGSDALTQMTAVTGAYPIDIDSDEQMDLFVMRVGENKLLRGLPNCKFEDANKLWNVDGADRWTTSFSATWESDNKLPTLAVGNYVDRKNPDGPFNACDTNQLYRPDGERYSVPENLSPGYCALSMLISDWTRSGRRDLRISNDRQYYVRDGHEQMWRLDDMRELTADDGWQWVSVWGMGIASQDINGDAAPDIVLTSMGDQLMQFYAGGATMQNAPFDIGTYSHRPYTGGDGRPSTGWHAEFGDVDNNGLPDLFIAKGNVDQMPGMATKDPNNMLMQQPDGKFVEVGLEAGLANFARSRGAAVADFNLDGKLDIAVMNRRAPFEIYENVSMNTGNFIVLKIQQPSINKNAIGAWVEMRTNDKTQTKEITIGGGHASGEISPVHFGLGDALNAQFRVVWPDGVTSPWADVVANQMLVATRIDKGSIKLSPLQVEK